MADSTAIPCNRPRTVHHLLATSMGLFSIYREHLEHLESVGVKADDIQFRNSLPSALLLHTTGSDIDWNKKKEQHVRFSYIQHC